MTLEHKKANREKWFALIKEQENSGLSQIEFCKINQINYAKFCYYKNALIIKPLKISSASKQEASEATKNNFSKINIKPHPVISIAEIKLSLPNGINCIIPSHVEMRQIKMLVEVLLSC